jgi:hypothetical protein
MIAAACTYDIPALNPTVDGGGDVRSTGGDDAELPDSSQAEDGAPDAPGGTPGYHDMTTPSFWSLFDTATVITGTPQIFAGGTFDGRYVFFSPYTSGSTVRLDTQASFTDKGSWSSYDVSGVLSGSSTGFFGAAFDGRYAYFTPYSAGTQSTVDGVVVRYDSQGSFGDSTSWSPYNARSANMNAEGFAGEVFDGQQYLYLVPDSENLAARLDVTAYGQNSALTFFDTTLFGAQKQGYLGAVYDGHHVTYVPNLSTVVAQYDTTGAFNDVASWTTFDVGSITTNGAEFVGAVFDGRYVYLVPNGTMSGLLSLVARYDTQASLGSTTGWLVFDVSKVSSGARGFTGGAFDGRYVYLIPWANSESTGAPAFDGVIVRFDTTAGPSGFQDVSNWSSFDTSTLSSNATGFFGAVFDGRFLYLVPNVGTVVARFDARYPPLMPSLPGFHGSFF